MESRKRKSPKEIYIDSITDPPEKLRKCSDFYNNLRTFYKRRWNAPLRLPTVQGVEINLYRLYEAVQSIGGWQKVSSAEKWGVIAELMGCQNGVACSDHAVKILYMRYLSKFEQFQTIGDVDDYLDNEVGRARGRGNSSFFATNECPISMSRLNPYLPRDDKGNIINEPDYNKLVKSLLSGLPNEVDFAINVCMLLSHTGPKQLKISNEPFLLTILVAHTGIYDDSKESLEDLGKVWREASNHNFRSFWASCGAPKELIKTFTGIQIEEEDPDEEFFTGLTHTFSVSDPVSWRLNQVVTIIRNFSFEPANHLTIINTWPVMKFLYLCAHCRYAPLFTAAYDALSNLSFDIDITFSKMVYSNNNEALHLINDGIYSKDKFKIIRSLEILTGLASYEGNETIICEWFKKDIVDYVFDMIGVKDIMMCVYILECLYQLSEIGDDACDIISSSNTAIQQLISMSTLEAVSFGAGGLAGMKVVEYQPQFNGNQQNNQYNSTPKPGVSGENHAHHQQRPPHLQNQQHQSHQPIQQHHQQHPQQQHHHHQQQQQLQQRNNQQQQNMHLQHPRANSNMTVRQYCQVMQAGKGLSQIQKPISSPKPNIQNNAITNTKQNSNSCIRIQPIVPNGNTGDRQVEKLTEKWIKENCVYEPKMSTPRGELYAAYVDDLRTQYHSLSGSLALFSGVMKNLYPDVVFRITDNGIMIVAQGIRLIRPHKLVPAAKVSTEKEETHPLMKKMLSQTDNLPNEKVSNSIDGIKNNLEDIKNEEKPSATDDKLAPDSKALNESKSELESDKLPNGKYSGTTESRKKPSIAMRAANILAHANMEKEKNDDLNEKKSDSKLGSVNMKTDYMCEWDCCSLYFLSPGHIMRHLCEEHIVEDLRLMCRWNNCADQTPRNRWSLVTHIQDCHCNESILKAAAQRRLEFVNSPRTIKSNDFPVKDYRNHPGYSQNAAMEAVKRHSQNYITRDVTDEAEGPVTKSIRLSSCLILRNLARYSAEGRKKLRRHESHLCWIALSRLEGSYALSQLLAELQKANATIGEEDMVSVPSSSSICSDFSSANTNSHSNSPKTFPTVSTKQHEKNVTKPCVENGGYTLQKPVLFPSHPHGSPHSDMPPPSLPCATSRPRIPKQTVVTTPVRAGAGR